MFNIQDYKQIKCIHVIENGLVTYEYVRKSNSEDELFPVGCIFKSFLSVLVGIAIQEKRIGSINNTLIDYFEHDDEVGINLYKLKIKHALSKTTGLVWPSPSEPLPANMSEVFNLEFENEPGKEFKYKPDPQIIIYLLEEVYHKNINEIMETKLLSHFHYQDLCWENFSDNMQVPIQTLDDLGQLMLHKGMCGIERLFSESYYEEMVQSYSNGGFPEMCPYGLGWWINEKTDVPYFFGAGFGGQILAVVPQKNMVVTLLSDMDYPHGDNLNIVESFMM